MARTKLPEAASELLGAGGNRTPAASYIRVLMDECYKQAHASSIAGLNDDASDWRSLGTEFQDLLEDADLAADEEDEEDEYDDEDDEWGEDWRDEEDEEDF